MNRLRMKPPNSILSLETIAQPDTDENLHQEGGNDGEDPRFALQL
jgi:hypothetical protein